MSGKEVEVEAGNAQKNKMRMKDRVGWPKWTEKHKAGKSVERNHRRPQMAEFLGETELCLTVLLLMKGFFTINKKFRGA